MFCRAYPKQQVEGEDDVLNVAPAAVKISADCVFKVVNWQFECIIVDAARDLLEKLVSVRHGH